MKTLLKDKEAIHTPTLELAKRVATALHEDGYRWNGGESLLDNPKWENYRGHHTLHIHLNYTEINYGSVDGYVKDNGYTIIPAEEFLQRVNTWSVAGGKELKGTNFINWPGNPHLFAGDASYRYYNFDGFKIECEQTRKPKYREITIQDFLKIKNNKMKYKLKVEYPGSPKVGTVVEEDMSGYPQYYEVVNPLPKYIRMLPGWDSGLTGRVFDTTVPPPSERENWTKYITWEYIWNTPIHRRHFTDASFHELQEQNKIEVAGYTLERIGSDYKFGCQTFSKAEVKTIKRLLESPINAEITIQGTKITQDLINKL